MNDPASQLPLFTFGSLRRGEQNHHYLAGRYARVFPAVLPGFRRDITAHGYAAAVPAAGESISGELYFLAADQYDSVLRDCDRLEDLPTGELVGEYYRRAQVTVDTSEGIFTAWAYIDPGSAM